MSSSSLWGVVRPVRNAARVSLAASRRGAFPTTQEDLDADLVSLQKETVGLLLLEREVVGTGAGGDPHARGRRLVLVDAPESFLLGLLVLDLAEIRDAAHGRLRLGRDLDEIHLDLAGARDRGRDLHLAETFAVFIDNEHDRRGNPLVGAIGRCDDLDGFLGPEAPATHRKACFILWS